MLWTQITLGLEGANLKKTNLRFGSVSTSVTPSRPGYSRASNPVWVSKREKDEAQNQYRFQANYFPAANKF